MLHGSEILPVRKRLGLELDAIISELQQTFVMVWACSAKKDNDWVKKRME